MKTKYLCMFLPVLLYVGTSLAQTSDNSPQQPIIENTSNLPDEIEYKKIGDIDQRFMAVKNAKIEDIARAIGEVDEWFFAQEDENPARKKIENEIEKLRVQIEAEVAKLLKEALDAKTGKEAHRQISAVNSLLSFYPAPKTAPERAKLEQITLSILNTSQRVEDIRRLRYNQWAITNIHHNLGVYRNETRPFPPNKRPNKEVLLGECQKSMAIIDPAFLEPAVLDLYNYVYGLIREIITKDDGYLIAFVRVFANPNAKRYTPSDF